MVVFVGDYVDCINLIKLKCSVIWFKWFIVFFYRLCNIDMINFFGLFVVFRYIIELVVCVDFVWV